MHLMCGRFGTLKMQRPASLDKKLMNSVGEGTFETPTLMKNRTIINILSNFIPQEFVVCDDKDPPWFNKKIRTLIQEKKCCI